MYYEGIFIDYEGKKQDYEGTTRFVKKQINP